MISLLLAATVAGCHSRQANGDANIVAADNNAAAQTSFDTLPADESSTTPSNQLVNGLDNPDVNDISAANSD